MKKILLVFDGPHFSEGAFAFAKELNSRQRIFLTAAFLPQVDYANLWSYSGGGASADVFIPLVENQDAEQVKENMDRFVSLCKQNHIAYSMHKDFLDFVTPELKKESRFADLVILGSETFYQGMGMADPVTYLQDALHQMECPVLLVPEKFSFPKTNILAYDGSASSVFAIKQFAYLFPELTDNPTLVISQQADDEELKEKKNIEELIARHYNAPGFCKVDQDKEALIAWLEDKKQAILVAGSFSKSAIRRIFHKSFIADIIQQHSIPIFISHL